MSAVFLFRLCYFQTRKYHVTLPQIIYIKYFSSGYSHVPGNRSSPYAMQCFEDVLIKTAKGRVLRGIITIATARRDEMLEF